MNPTPELQKGWTPPIAHTTSGVIAVWGMVVNAAYQVLSTVVMASFIVMIGTVLGVIAQGYGAGGTPVQTLIGIAAVVVLSLLVLAVPFVSAAFSLYTAIALHRGGHPPFVYLGIIASVLGPSTLAFFSLFTVLFTGIFGLVVFLVSAVMFIICVTISALAAATLSREMRLLREEGLSDYAESVA